MSDFIVKHKISQRRCIYIVEDGGRCICGLEIERHDQDVLDSYNQSKGGSNRELTRPSSTNNSNREWTRSSSTTNMVPPSIRKDWNLGGIKQSDSYKVEVPILNSTDSYGQISINENRDADSAPKKYYLKLDFDTPTETLYEVVLDYFELKNQPDFVINMIGNSPGDENNKHLKEIADLAKKNSNKSGWIITNGFSIDHESYEKLKASNLTIIGMYHWGILNIRDELKYSPGIKFIHPKHYAEQNLDTDEFLNPYYDHYLLVDDATYRRGLTETYINMMAKFSRYLIDKKKVPTITLAFDEKLNTIRILARLIEYKLPCVQIGEENDCKFSKFLDESQNPKAIASSTLNDDQLIRDFQRKFFSDDPNDVYKSLSSTVIQQRYEKDLIGSIKNIRDRSKYKDLLKRQTSLFSSPLFSRF